MKRFNQFKDMFFQSTFPTSSVDQDNFSEIYLNYLDDIENFRFSPFLPIKYQLERDDFLRMKIAILYQATNTSLTSGIFIHMAFNQILCATNAYLCDMLIEEKHFLWPILNTLSAWMRHHQQLADGISYCERLQCLLVKSIAASYTSFAYLVLSTLDSQKNILEATQNPLSESLAVGIGRPHWTGYGLVDIADEVRNEHIKNWLLRVGATPVMTKERHAPPPSSPIFFSEEEEQKNTRAPMRPRAQAYEDLTELLHQPSH